MNLQKVTGKPFRCTCVQCGWRNSTDNEDFTADLDGKPFKDYYCSKCTQKLNAETIKLMRLK